jgi:hypothetical protein
MYTENEYDHPYDVGRYQYVRSSKDKFAMMWEEEAMFDASSNRWFERFGCSYACRRDGMALFEEDEYDLLGFHINHRRINCKESFFEIEYENKDSDIAYGYFCLTEYVGRKHRSFHFNFRNLSAEEFAAYVSAVEDWHLTGELNIDKYSGVPPYAPWERR